MPQRATVAKPKPKPKHSEIKLLNPKTPERPCSPKSYILNSERGAQGPQTLMDGLVVGLIHCHRPELVQERSPTPIPEMLRDLYGRALGLRLLGFRV